ncbi:CH-like domain in sperm protein,Calponin homology domain [Cinara cedri]|uniref:CH-like domain in sperm protein,Calponin homology domain n=1 Tax=Cinara cedri TaxID=506608 RepID=A0A5E4N6I1_9HEMI|nr:CH-like domain in sperm protein,Calponin homology domain [Cinara cedri]
MFEILKEWLICKLGLNFCLSLSYDNIGEIFKDGVLFARLLHIYQVLPDQYIECFKKNNFYTVCLNNIKSINVWLQYLNIKIEDNVIQEIAHGKSPAVIYLLYQLYLKLEEKPCQVPDDINKKENVQFNNNVMTNSCKISSIQRNLRSKPKEKVWKKSSNLNTEKWNVLKLFCCLEGTQYTAIDILKSNKRIKGSILDFIQNNMNCFYNLLINNLNDKFFENEITDKSNQICRCIIVDNLNLTDGNNVSIDEFDSNNTKLINNLNLEININKQNILVTQLDSASQIVQNNKNVSDNLYLSREELKNENLMGSKINESSTTQGIDDHENIHFVKQNIFNEYTQHSGVWSNEYLNSEQFECKQHMLSMIVTEIINFDNSKTEIKCMDINKTSIAGVIDVMQNTTVVKLIKYILGTKRILNFTTNDAINACLDAYKKELEISLNKGELYQVLDNEQHAITKNQSNNLTLEKNSNSNKSEIRRFAWESTEEAGLTNKAKRSGDKSAPCGTSDKRVKKKELKS